jgi:hypothetical protein
MEQLSRRRFLFVHSRSEWDSSFYAFNHGIQLSTDGRNRFQ